LFVPKSILVPTDFSEFSDKAFKYALDIAKRNNARIFLLHVIDGTIQRFIADYCIDTKVVERVVSESVITSNANLQKMIDSISEKKEVKIITDVRRGVPYEEILKNQQEQEIDLIVIASHGRTGLKKLFIGSVAEKVIREAECTVLLVRNEKG